MHTFVNSEGDRQNVRQQSNRATHRVSRPVKPMALWPLPTLGRAKADIVTGAEGNFDLLEGWPIAVGSGTRMARNVCLDTINTGDDCTLMWYAMQGTGGFWGATKCGGMAPISTVTCSHCVSNEMPEFVSLTIACTDVIGGVTSGDSALGVEWSTFVDGTHTITMAGCGQSTLVIDCGTTSAVNDVGSWSSQIATGTAARCQILIRATTDSYLEVLLRFQVNDGGWTDIGDYEANYDSDGDYRSATFTSGTLTCKATHDLLPNAATLPADIISASQMQWM